MHSTVTQFTSLDIFLLKENVFVQNEILENKLFNYLKNQHWKTILHSMVVQIPWIFMQIKIHSWMYSFGVECKNPFKLEKSDEKKKKRLCWTITLPFSPFRTFFLPLAFPTREATSSSNLLHLFKKNCLILAMNLSNYFLEISQKSYEPIPRIIWTWKWKPNKILIHSQIGWLLFKFQ